MLPRILAAIALFCSITILAQETSLVSQQQLMSLLNAEKAPPFVVLDVRRPDEFAAGHIPGAINISHDVIGERLAQLADDKDTMLIVHCHSGRRAAIALQVLEQHGFHKLRHLNGDMKAWREAGLPLQVEK